MPNSIDNDIKSVTTGTQATDFSVKKVTAWGHFVTIFTFLPWQLIHLITKITEYVLAKKSGETMENPDKLDDNFILKVDTLYEPKINFTSPTEEVTPFSESDTLPMDKQKFLQEYQECVSLLNSIKSKKDFKELEEKISKFIERTDLSEDNKITLKILKSTFDFLRQILIEAPFKVNLNEKNELIAEDDGSCLFHSIGYGFNLVKEAIGEDFITLRKQAVNYIQDHWNNDKELKSKVLDEIKGQNQALIDAEGIEGLKQMFENGLIVEEEYEQALKDAEARIEKKKMDKEIIDLTDEIQAIMIFLGKLAENKTWGGGACIYALALLYRVDIHVVYPTGACEEFDPAKSNKKITIAHVGSGTHFNPLKATVK